MAQMLGLVMLKIDLKQFAHDHVWFGWYFTGQGWNVGHTRNPLICWKIVTMDDVMADKYLYYNMDGSPRD